MNMYNPICYSEREIRQSKMDDVILCDVILSLKETGFFRNKAKNVVIDLITHEVRNHLKNMRELEAYIVEQLSSKSSEDK